MQQTAVDIYLKALDEAVFSRIKKNMTTLAWQKELRTLPKFKDAETKITDWSSYYIRVREALETRDRIMDILRRIKSSRMTQFFEKGKDITPEESEEIQVAIAPYLSLLPPIAEIRKLQFALMSHARLKRLSLQYAEVEATLKEITALTDQLPKILMDGVNAMVDSLEQVA
ncbi:MAG: hypothetical protein HY221_02455 [Candidatus Sungbacteria bacterium]|uniref:Uncharacterized protein n=1 Tax=Candidatus Sungiibacteriota bacterium TaxID=2750080 RepID=A0A932QYH5_9BACT|nr:hypothetical protein [Candidatus Sungbacteria bacterium]